MARPTALLFQTHFFDRGAARLFKRLRRQCPPNFECFVLRLWCTNWLMGAERRL